MKKFSFLFLFGILLSAYSVEAQAQLSIEPNPVYVDGIVPANVDVVGHSFFHTDVTGNYTWQRTVIEISEGWETAVCDPIQCYLTGLNSASFELNAGTPGTMDVHVYPNGVNGAAIVQVEVYETANPENSTTGMYYFNHGTNGVAEKFSEAVKIYPNPTQDWIAVDNVDNTVATADLYDVKGKLIQSTTVNGNQRISIQDFPAGNYILKMMDKAGNVVSTNHVVKN